MKIYKINFNGDFKIKREINIKIIRLGTPSAMQMLFEVVLFTAAIWLCGIIGVTSQGFSKKLYR